MLENPLYIGDRIIDLADLQEDINTIAQAPMDLDLLGEEGVLSILVNYMRFSADICFIEHFQNEYGVDMSRPLQYKKFSRPIAVNPITQEWGYVDRLYYGPYDDMPSGVDLYIENPVNSDDAREWGRGEFLLIWEGLVHQEITGGIQT